MSIDLSGADKHGNMYLRTAEIREITESIKPETDIFLHVDMDYFNNRYNGSNEWRSHAVRHDQALDRQKEAIEKICHHLLVAGLVGRIKHVSIGISPSFYPAEFWQEGTSYLLKQLATLGLSVTDLMELIASNDSQKKKGGAEWHNHGNRNA